MPYLVAIVLAAILISFIAVRIGAFALVLTGMETEAATFQALSAFSGTGFTTSETERVVRHRSRRRIITILIILGNAGLVTIIGSLVASFRSPGRATGGLYYELPYLWFADCANPTGSIYQVTTAGSIITTVTVPGARPFGVAREGPYIWYSDFTRRYVYKVTYSPTAVAPASLGKVKAVFR